MKISQGTVGYTQNKQERLLVGIRGKSFQLISVHLTTDIPETEIGDLVGPVSTVQQACLAQYLGPTPGMVFTDRHISACCPRATFEFPVTMSSIKSKERPISRVEPRGSWKHSLIRFVTEDPNSYVTPLQNEITQSEIELLRGFIRMYTNSSPNALIIFPSQKRVTQSTKSDRTFRATLHDAEPSSAHIIACIRRHKVFRSFGGISGSQPRAQMCAL